MGWKRVLPRLSAVCGGLLYDLKRAESKIEVDAVDGIKVVKANVIENELVRQHRALLEEEAKPTLQMVIFRYGPMLMNEFMASAVVIGFGMLSIFRPETGLTFATLIALLLAMRRASPALSSITSSLVDLNKSRKGLEILEELDHRTHLERERGNDVAGPVEEIRFENAAFYYDVKPGQWALQDVNLSLKRGTVTALVGSTGSGKSTLANLLIGLYDLKSGAVLVNGQDMRSLALPAWRKKVGYLCQDIFLFNATLRENIALWNPSVKAADVEQAARHAQLHDFVQTLPEKYDTIVGDRGLKLSGGQCQRVAIARAILRQPDVLIFDEATSALDNLTEKAVYEAISLLRKNAVVVIIAHRLGTIKDADQIVVLQAGRVAEKGTHAGLLAQSGVYARLYQGDAFRESDTERSVAL